MKAAPFTPTEVPEANPAFSSETSARSYSQSRLQSCVKVCGQADALPFDSRVAAGRLLGRKIIANRILSEPLVLAASPGAAEVAQQISEALHAPLDLLFSQDVSLPWQRDVVLATVNSDGGRFLDESASRSLRLSRYFLYNCIARTEAELQRRVHTCRAGAPSPSRLRKRIILVDDGEARPSHLAAAIRSLRKHDATEVMFAAPIASLESVKAVADDVNLCLLLALSDPLKPASAYYLSFPKVSDDQVQQILEPQKALESLAASAMAGGY